jgi:protein-S-isoprenylcysteine O-methyltransferase Ste14
MKILSSSRYVVAFLVLASFPPAVLLWVAIHPLDAFWRKLGPAWTYGLLGMPVAAYMAAAWLNRRAWLGKDLGSCVPTLAPAALLFVAAMLLLKARRRHLSFGRLSGLPELSPSLYPGKLLTEGIYGRIRHPRYVEVTFINLSYALFANYTGVYLVVALGFPLLYLVVVLEERELRRRFGAAYEEYCRRVPRFVPRLKGGRE